MQLHISKSPSVNSEDSQPAVRGRGLAHRKLSPQERASLAADLVSGQCRFEPSLAQASALLHVTPAAVREELRARQKNGHTEAAVAEAIVQAWNNGSDSDREIAFRDIGVAEVWDVLSRIVA
jgi:hypothetical protein